MCVYFIINSRCNYEPRANNTQFIHSFRYSNDTYFQVWYREKISEKVWPYIASLFIVLLFISLLMGMRKLIQVRSAFNSNAIKELKADVYSYYSKLTHNFTYTLDYGGEVPPRVKTSELELVEHFLVIITKHDSLLPLYMNNFSLLTPSDPKFFQYVHMFSLHSLLENDIDAFIKYYSEYRDRIFLRTESRVLGEKLYRVKFGYDYYDIPIYLLDTMFEYYSLGKAIDSEIMRFRPKCKLDEMIYMTCLYHYLEATENTKMLSDIETEYMKYKEVRKNL